MSEAKDDKVLRVDFKDKNVEDVVDRKLKPLVDRIEELEGVVDEQDELIESLLNNDHKLNEQNKRLVERLKDFERGIVRKRGEVVKKNSKGYAVWFEDGSCSFIANKMWNGPDDPELRKMMEIRVPSKVSIDEPVKNNFFCKFKNPPKNGKTLNWKVSCWGKMGRLYDIYILRGEPEVDETRTLTVIPEGLRYSWPNRM